MIEWVLHRMRLAYRLAVYLLTINSEPQMKEHMIEQDRCMIECQKVGHLAGLVKSCYM